jgi:hypothetical protein
MQMIRFKLRGTPAGRRPAKMRPDVEKAADIAMEHTHNGGLD